jgi:hypothetical protein
MYEFSRNQEPKSLGRWVAKLVAGLLATAVLWVQFQTSLKNTKWDMYISKGVGNVREPPVHKSLIQYTVYLFTQGRGRELTREKVEGAIVHKAGRKYSHGLYLKPTNSIENQ